MYEDADITKTVYLQLHTQKLQNGLYEAKYVWFEGQPDSVQGWDELKRVS